MPLLCSQPCNGFPSSAQEALHHLTPPSFSHVFWCLLSCCSVHRRRISLLFAPQTCLVAFAPAIPSASDVLRKVHCFLLKLWLNCHLLGATLGASAIISVTFHQAMLLSSLYSIQHNLAFLCLRVHCVSLMEAVSLSRSPPHPRNRLITQLVNEITQMSK